MHSRDRYLNGRKGYFLISLKSSSLKSYVSSLMPYQFQRLSEKNLSVKYFRNVKEWIFYSSSKYENQFLNTINYKICTKTDIMRLTETTKTVFPSTLLPYLKATWDRPDYIQAGGSFRSST